MIELAKEDIPATVPPPDLRIEDEFVVTAYGVAARFRASSWAFRSEFLKHLDRELPQYECLADSELPIILDLTWDWSRDGLDRVFGNAELPGDATSRELLLEQVSARVRLAIAEFADGRVFVHAGVVTLDEKAILIPGSSFSGKTTLVEALLSVGARYYSDEYAVINQEGMVEAFTRPLGIRNHSEDRFRSVPHSPETITELIGGPPVPITLIVVTEYVEGAEWKPEMLSPGEGLIEILKHTVPIRRRPAFTMDVLGRAVEKAGIVRSPRGDASQLVGKLKLFL